MNAFQVQYVIIVRITQIAITSLGAQDGVLGTRRGPPPERRSSSASDSSVVQRTTKGRIATGDGRNRLRPIARGTFGEEPRGGVLRFREEVCDALAVRLSLADSAVEIAYLAVMLSAQVFVNIRVR